MQAHKASVHLIYLERTHTQRWAFSGAASECLPHPEVFGTSMSSAVKWKHTQKFWHSNIIISRPYSEGQQSIEMDFRTRGACRQTLCSCLGKVESVCSWRQNWAASSTPLTVRSYVSRAVRVCISHILSFPRLLVSVEWPPSAPVPHGAGTVCQPQPELRVLCIWWGGAYHLSRPSSPIFTTKLCVP